MSAYSASAPDAQPIRESVRRIFSQIIANAEPPAVQKEMILIARENGLISDADCLALICWYGLEAE